MKKLFIISIILFLGACSPQTPQSNLNKSISEMLLLIDQKKDQEFLAQYVDFTGETNTRTELSDSALKEIRFYLLKAKELTPQFSKDNTSAVYINPAFEEPLKFIKIGNKWLIRAG